MIESRRPLKSRGTGWARAAAAGLARIGATPDVISASSLLFAAVGFWAFWQSADASDSARATWLLLAGLCVQLRLLANLLDGMVAVEHGRGGALGPIWNELPDRVADALFLVGAGYALRVYDPAFGPALGWAAAVLAVMTAYVRELGHALTQTVDFCGPGAKPHRMAVLTAGCVLSAIGAVVLPDWDRAVLWLALATVVLLAAATVLRRTARLAARLKGSAPAA
ncbi:MAG TPA: CDP-alcohol phosphatidyltransferase family protein [Brevundimonas sp.]|jgi:phosphatidylglycerophosphate synthase|uniref:CDP-alcohol phosphatidyltransferase family protein n=1 Tax=Brevundimonas sp. TaxID=1871086 RepID=UPI002DE3E4B6|nr:CDP-alcohol phosphatidyltransferase family protein [Brevundimonas sp.]